MIQFYTQQYCPFVAPDSFEFEVVERKFRGHPDSLADMVAKRFSQRYIQHSWEKIPELERTKFPNFSADKVTLSGASTHYKNGVVTVTKPVHALLIGKVTGQVGDISLDVDAQFEQAINDILSRALNTQDFVPHVVREHYAATLAGTDHHSGFYNPKSTQELLNILGEETVANDTVYVVAYAPLSRTEKLSIFLDSLTASAEFQTAFPEIGSDIKAMIRRRGESFDITLCLPVFPEIVIDNQRYDAVVRSAGEYLTQAIQKYLRVLNGGSATPEVRLHTNTKDTAQKKYFAVWGTALSKGDIGAVGRGNRHQGFISGIRPSTNEAVPGKNPNHFAGILYQLLAERMAYEIHKQLGLKNVIYITANNGDRLGQPHSIDVILENNEAGLQQKAQEIIQEQLGRLKEIRAEFIASDVFESFMHPLIFQ